MLETYSQLKVEELFAAADIKVNGDRPGDIQVHNPDFYARALTQGSLGIGESYMDGWWDCERVDEFFTKIFYAKIDRKVAPWKLIIPYLTAKIANLQSRKKAPEVCERHYNLGNDLYQTMLDNRMTYTCGYWKNAQTLEQAQEDKLELVCKKLGLREGQRVLDIGCGWGSFLKYAAEKHGAEGVGITISNEQIELAQKLCKGLPIEIRYQDYRDVHEKFDHVVSLGMFEHVGYKNHRKYLEVASGCLKDEGLFLLHTIGGNRSEVDIDPWIAKYIFPNSVLPSIAQIGSAMEDLFVMEDWHNFGLDYGRTLMEWHTNFETHWDSLKDRYDEQFHRMWNFYLLSCAGTFRARRNQLWQIVLSKDGVPGGYQSIR